LVEAGAVLDGTYKIVRRIGDGGMGEVYEARHSRLSGRYAVKVLNATVSAQPDAEARFRREAQVTSALRHPGIVQIIDFNTTYTGMSYLVMEYLEGENLEKLLDREGGLPIDRMVDITRQVAAALTEAHRNGVVHRDLKPQNIFLLARKPGDDEPERTKVLDFGISKIRSASRGLTETSVVLGTPQYMSPEQAEGKTGDVDVATDQFALAAIAYEMLTGLPAFTGDTLASVVYKVVHQEPEPIAARRPDAPRQLQKVIARGLSKRKQDRYASVAEFAAHLRAAGQAPGTRRRAETPASARPPGLDGRRPAFPAAPRPAPVAETARLVSPPARGEEPRPRQPTNAAAATGGTTLGRHTGELLRLVTGATRKNRARLIVAASLALLFVGFSAGLRAVRRSPGRSPASSALASASPAAATRPARPPSGFAVQPIPSPPEPAPAPVAAAEFDIASDPPGIALWVDGQPYPGPTKQAVTRARGSLPVGTHTFELAKLGFQTWRRAVEMTPDAPTRFLARLKRDDASPAAPWPPPVPTTGRAGAGAAVAQKSPSTTPPPATTCLLTVGATPWAEVWIDGENTRHHTPAVELALPCGSHRLDLRRPDLNINFTTNVTVSPGKVLKQKFHLEGDGDANKPP
jgi:serine/threonine-protein kinase